MSPTNTQSKPTVGLQAESRAALEGFPRILEKVTLLWKSRELDGFINDLILDSRDGARQGFPAEVVTELMFLAETDRLVCTIEDAQTPRMELPKAYAMVLTGDAASVVVNPWGDLDGSTDSSFSPKSRAISTGQVTGPVKDNRQSPPVSGFDRPALGKLLLVMLIALLCLVLLWQVFS